MPSPREKAPKPPKFPSFQKRCRYCHLMFNTKPTYNGSQMKFCCPAHRKAFDKEGQTPIAAVLRRQEKRMREICREEIKEALVAYHAGIQLHAALKPTETAA